MKPAWYPQNPRELMLMLNFLIQNPNKKIVKGLIVPHAGYQFSGKIAGKAYGLIKTTPKKAIILGPSHYENFQGIKSLKKITTPLGKVNIIPNNYKKIEYEHSIDNQIPFLQYLNPDIEILPLVVGEITNKEAEKIAEEISKINGMYIISTDLSHFLDYETAIEKDKQTIKILKNLDFQNFEKIDACGKYPLLILMNLLKQKKLKLNLIEYKNSGDLTYDKSRVVGYASFWF